MDAKRCDRCGFGSSVRKIKGWSEVLVRSVNYDARHHALSIQGPTEDGLDFCPACTKAIADVLVPLKTATRRAAR